VSTWQTFAMNDYEFDWIQKRAECARCEDTKGIVIHRNSQVVGAVVLDSWSYNSVTIHVAIDDLLCMKHGFPEEVFNYIFNTCDKGVVIGITPANNEKALRFNKRIGLVELYRIRDGYDVGIDYVVQELRKENCRYIEHGQKDNSKAA